ncbi:MAG: HD domain-containing protein [Nitrospirae bacterium]|nr:MAG: HD domain-containing protein [Nitrospirota bacterium]
MSTKIINIPEQPPEDGLQSYKEYTLNAEQYYLIDQAFLVPGQKVSFRIFSLHGQMLKLVLDADESAPAAIDKTTVDEKSDFLIKSSDIPLYQDYLSMLTKTDSAFKGDKSKAAVIIKEQSKMVMKDLFANPVSRQTVETVRDTASHIIKCIFEEPEVIYDLLTLKKHDFYSYMHSVNVAVLCIGLGRIMGLPEKTIEHHGTGALLHDIGKTAIPLEILNKQGKLSSAEFHIYKTHVAQGMKILKEVGGLPDESLIIVLQHHEKLTGKGYPLGLSDKEIKTAGRISAIADCYDYLTTPRPNKYALNPYEALKTIAAEKEDYDRALLAAFVKMLGKMAKTS